MATNQRTQAHGILDAPSWLRRTPWLSLAIACTLASCWFAASGKRPGRFGAGPQPSLATVAVDQGDVDLVVTETGFLESSVDDVVRCRVESFLRLPVGAQRVGVEPRSSQPRASKVGGPAGASASRSRESSIDAVTKAVSAAKSKLGGAPIGGATAKRAGTSAGGGTSGFVSSSNASADSGFLDRRAGRRSAALNTSSSRMFPFVRRFRTRVRWQRRPLRR